MLHFEFRNRVCGIYYNECMKHLIIICTIFLVGCSSKNTEWDSGSAKQDAYQVERMEEQTESTRNQFPAVGPSTEVP